jgi:bifunctional pyridoxal-dependent enzyme with beta-cystathionase and maltose regulon repressor activities
VERFVGRTTVNYKITLSGDAVITGVDNAHNTSAAPVSPASSRNTITVTSASKSFNLSGLKHSRHLRKPALREAYDGGQRKSNTYYGGSTMASLPPRQP